MPMSPCLGWDIFDTGTAYEIQACDECKQYPDDDTAALAARKWIIAQKEKAQ
jgi:hypothetical protein